MKTTRKLFALAFSAITALGATAAVWNATSFPPPNPGPSEQEPVKGIMRAPLNQERAKGLKVFGATMIDYDIVRHYVNYYENQYALDKLSWISREGEKGISQDRRIHSIFAGAYNPDDGNYYAYKVMLYTFEHEPYQWVKVNPRTGEWSVIKEFESHEHASDYLYDMAYSVYDSEMFGLTQSIDGTVTSRIARMNLSDSSMEDYIQLDQYYFAIAFDYDGNLFGIRWKGDDAGNITGTMLDEFDSDFKVKKSTEILVDGKPYVSYFQHGLDFNYSTGELVWSACDMEGKQIMVVIDPDTYQTTNLGNIGYGETMIGLYVPFETATDRLAPAKVDRLSVLRNRDGSETVTLTWRNPSTTWNRKELTDLSEVYIYRDSRDSEPVGKVDAVGKEGKSGRFVDTAPNGVHTYYLRAVNAKGLGVTDSIEGFSGRDVPGKVSDLTVRAIDEGHGVNISWGLPSTGDSEGWYDSNLTYTVTRNPGNVTVAKDIAETSFDDKDIKEAQYYTYTVVPKSVDGEGTPNTSDGILAGSSLVIPFETSFETSNEAARFTSLNAFGVNNQFEYTKGSDGVTPVMRYFYTSDNDNALVSPPLGVEKGKKYHVSWSYELCRYGFTFEDHYNDFRIIAGPSMSYDALTVVAADIKQQLTEKNHEKFTVDGYFEAPEDGEYYVAFQVLTKDKNNEAWIYINNFKITPSPDDDLGVVDVEVPAFVSSADDNYFDVTVYNNGSNPQSNYKVEVGISQLNGTFVPFATTTEVPALAAHEKAVVRVKGHTASTGIQDLQAHVILEGDGFAGNDFSDYKEVEFYDGAPFNFHAVDDASEWEDSSVPFCLFTEHSMSQSIYPAAKFGFDVKEPEIAGLGWEYKSERDIDDVELQILLGQTDQQEYSNDNPEYLGGQTLVYEGTVKLEEGSHWLKVNFPEKSFKVDPTKNLVVTVLCHETDANGSFPTLFKVINSPQTGERHYEKLNHTITYRGNAAYTGGAERLFAANHMAKLHVAVKSDASGIEQVATADLNVILRGKTLSVTGDARTIEVYDLGGRALSRLAVNGSASVELPVSAGVYVVKVTAADGNTVARKIMVR